MLVQNLHDQDWWKMREFIGMFLVLVFQMENSSLNAVEATLCDDL